MPASDRNDIYGFLVVVVGLVVLLVAFVIAANRWTDAKDFATAMSVITAAIAAIVGAYFGVKIGERGKKQVQGALEAAQADNRLLHDRIARFAAETSPEIASRILEKR
jgi:vacuolar-type H+-ATPase subunit I/STV1